MKKISLFILLTLISFIIIGCSSNTTTSLTNITTSGETSSDTTTLEPDVYNVEYNVLSEQLLIGENVLEEDEWFINHSSGGSHVIAKTNKNRYFAWGNNSKGQLGDGTTESKVTPVDITNNFPLQAGEYVINFSLGDSHSAAITNMGRVFTWGWNFYGRLGDGTTTSRSTPTDITSMFNLHTGEKVLTITMGVSNSAAKTTEGRIFVWGENSTGQLGDGTILNKSVPTDITGQFNLEVNELVVVISLGGVHSAAFTSKGRLFTWGGNAYGQLGDTTGGIKVNPTEITQYLTYTEGEFIIGIDLGRYNTVVLTSKGDVYTFGLNERGQLGDGTLVNKNTPTDIKSQFGLEPEETIIKVASGYSHMLLITSEYRVFTWGDNEFGQLGQGDTIHQSTPVEITSQLAFQEGETVNSIALGDGYSAMITSLGRFLTWGNNDNAQMGNIESSTVLIPTNIIQNSKVATVLKTEAYAYGSDITPHVPSRAGFTYAGWFTDEELTNPYTFNQMPNQNVILYTEWIPEN